MKFTRLVLFHVALLVAQRTGKMSRPRAGRHRRLLRPVAPLPPVPPAEVRAAVPAAHVKAPPREVNVLLPLVHPQATAYGGLFVRDVPMVLWAPRQVPPPAYNEVL